MKLVNLSFVLVPAVLATTLTEPPTKTVTQVLTVNFTPPETPQDNVVTKTLYETVHDAPSSITDQQTSQSSLNPQPGLLVQPAAPNNVLVPGLNVESTTSGVEVNKPNEEDELTDTQDSSDDQFGYDTEYFQSHLESNILNPSEKDFNLLNEEIDSQVIEDIDEYGNESSEDDDEEDDDDEDEHEYQPIEKPDIGADVEMSSPYHLDPNYRGRTNPKELEKPKPAGTSDEVNQPNPTLDQNTPLEHQQPRIDEQQQQDKDYHQEFENGAQLDDDFSNTHSNFTRPELDEDEHPIPQPVGEHEHDPLDQEEQITKGKQVLDKEETDSLVTGIKPSGSSKKVEGDKETTAYSNGFVQGNLIDKGETRVIYNKTKTRKPFSTTLTRMDDTSGGFKNHISLKSVLFVVGILAGFIISA